MKSTTGLSTISPTLIAEHLTKVIGSRTQLKAGAPVTPKVMTPPAAEGAR